MCEVCYDDWLENEGEDVVYITCEYCGDSVLAEESEYIEDLDIAVCPDCFWNEEGDLYLCDNCHKGFSEAAIDYAWPEEGIYYCKDCTKKLEAAGKLPKDNY